MSILDMVRGRCQTIQIGFADLKDGSIMSYASFTVLCLHQIYSLNDYAEAIQVITYDSGQRIFTS